MRTRRLRRSSPTGCLRTITAVSAMVMGLAAAPAAHAEKITLMVGGMEKIIYLPAKLTEALGYFKEEGLDVELASEPAGVNATNELIAGAAQGAVGFYDHTIDLQAKGKSLQSVVQMGIVSGHAVLASTKKPGVTGAADFGGKTIGVTGLGSSTAFLVQYLAKRNGVDVTKVRLLPVGAGSNFIAAMRQGTIEAGITTEPTISRLIGTGEAKVVVDLRTPEGARAALGGLYPAACLYMTSAYIQKHPQETQKLANAFVKTLRYIASHSAEEIATKVPKDYYAGDRGAYVKALDAAKVMFTSDGRMPEGGPETVLTILKDFRPDLKGKTIDLSKTYTTEFVAKANAVN
jgi:NitT/TauT family transport system substrate-binding protein